MLPPPFSKIEGRMDDALTAVSDFAAGGLTASFEELFICRVPALPLARVLDLHSDLLAAHSRVRRAIQSRITVERERLLDALYALVPLAPARAERRQLIELRRSVLKLEFDAQCYCTAPVPRETQAKLALLRHLVRRERKLRGQYAELWDGEESRTRHCLADVLADEEFRKGLALASPDLYGALDGHLACPATGYRSRDRKRERALLRYLTRAATKATPFGRFCTVISGSVQSDGEPGLAFSGSVTDRRSCPRLNKRLLARIVTFLLGDEECRREVPLGLNRTVRSEDGCHTFLTIIDGREVLQRLPAGSAVAAMLEHMRTQRTTTLENLERWLLDPAPENDPAAAAVYASTLLEIGLLRPHLGVADNEADWAPGVISVLGAMRSGKAHALAAALERLLEAFRGYDEASVDQRVRAQETAADVIRGVEEGLKGPLWVARDVIAYEDMTAVAHGTLGASNALASAAAVLAEYARITSVATPMVCSRRGMLGEFKKLYAGAKEDVPLLRFYEDHYRSVEEAEKKQEVGQAEIRGWPGAGLSTALARIWADSRDADEVDIPLAVLGGSVVAGGLPPEHPWQVSMFAHTLAATLERPERLLVPGGRYYSGYGKYLSRFLHLFPPGVHDAIRRANGSPPGMILAEIGGDADFNANLHPPLTPWMIEYPTADGPSGGTDVLRVTDLAVRANFDEGSLQIVHIPSGNHVLPLDLGFLSPSLRPPLFALLSLFSPPARFGLPLPGRPTGYKPEGSEILFRPRMSLAGDVVVARRQWMVPQALVPRRAARESWASYSLRVDDWRADAGIPSRIFARVAAHRAKNEEQRRELPRRDARKPQYIDFESPLLVQLFENLGPRKGSYSVLVEEQLPGPRDWVRTPAGDYAPELVLQLEVR